MYTKIPKSKHNFSDKKLIHQNSISYKNSTMDSPGNVFKYLIISVIVIKCCITSVSVLPCPLALTCKALHTLTPLFKYFCTPVGTFSTSYDQFYITEVTYINCTSVIYNTGEHRLKIPPIYVTLFRKKKKRNTITPC